MLTNAPDWAGKISKLWITLEEFKQIWPAVLRGTGLGAFLGLLPGGGAMLSSFASYAVEKKIAKDPSAAKVAVWGSWIALSATAKTAGITIAARAALLSEIRSGSAN